MSNGLSSEVPNLFKEISKQVPGLVCCIIIVVLFLNFIKTVLEDQRPITQQLMVVIKDNTEALRVNSIMVDRLERTITSGSNK